MSHLHERKEKTCLNCGATLTGRYCQDCGQENVEPKESAWHLIIHFFNDVTHFDGKFFSSLKYLLFKPGFLTEEYINGKRASYLNPIRMYLFISAIFFLIFVTFFLPHGDPIKTSSGTKPADTSTAKKITHGLREIAASLDSSDAESNADVVMLNNGDTISRAALDHFTPKTTLEYDSMQKILPEAERDGALGRYFNKKMIKTREFSEENKTEWKHRLSANFFHSLPYMLFISLPLIALLLKLLYIRRKQFYFVSHGIFIIHYYCLVFIGLMLALTFKQLGMWGQVAAGITELGIILYLYAAMYRFYKQGWFKTFVKYVLLVSIGMSIISVLTMFFVIYSILNIAG